MQIHFHRSGNLSHYAVSLGMLLALWSGSGHSFAQDLSNEGQNNPTKGVLSKSCYLTISSQEGNKVVDVIAKPLSQTKVIKSGRVLYEFGIDASFQPLRLAVDPDKSGDLTQALTKCVTSKGPRESVLTSEWRSDQTKAAACRVEFSGLCVIQ